MKEHYSEIANRVIEENGIEDGDIVGGSSLGGMIALEIARQKKLRGVVLIGSAVSSAEIQGILSLLAPLTVIAPISVIQLFVGKHESTTAKMFRRSGFGLYTSNVSVFAEMVRESG